MHKSLNTSKADVGHNHDTVYCSRADATQFVKIFGTNRIDSGMLTISGIHGVESHTYMNTYLVLEAHPEINATARAGIGFHNKNKVGCTLYLENNGELWVKWNDGVSKRIISK